MPGDIADADLEGAIVTDAPRFYLVNKDGHKFFVYCCPEDSKVGRPRDIGTWPHRRIDGCSDGWNVHDCLASQEVVDRSDA